MPELLPSNIVFDCTCNYLWASLSLDCPEDYRLWQQTMFTPIQHNVVQNPMWTVDAVGQGSGSTGCTSMFTVDVSTYCNSMANLPSVHRFGFFSIRQRPIFLHYLTALFIEMSYPVVLQLEQKFRSICLL